MADIKWIKIATNIHEDEKIRLIDAMPNPDTTHYVWLRLLIQAGKTNDNGHIYLSEEISYTEEMLATLFCRPLDSIKNALRILSSFKMIEIAPNNIIKIVNWDKHQNIEGMEKVRIQNRKRAENHREKKRQMEQNVKENSDADKSATGNEEESEYNNGNIKSKNENDSNITKDLNNVTHNESNVIVTQQNKKKIKNENKNKNKRDRESEDSNIIGDINNNDSTHDEKVKELSITQSEKLKDDSTALADKDINARAIELMTYHEKITGVVGGINYVTLRFAIDMHGEKAVKMAMDKALEANHTEMGYISGILKNWRREGYPKDDMEVKVNGGRRYTGKNNPADKNEFAGFKPKESRKLTETERKNVEANLI